VAGGQTDVMARVYLSLGSNLEPGKNLAAALRELRAQFGVLTVSATYVFPAVGFDGPDFWNLAVGLDTDWTPQALNTWLHELENRHGRRRDVPRFSSRTLDVDIVLYGNDVLRGEGNLEVPRDELRHAFVLKPLVEIAADLRHPVDGRTLDELWAAHADHAVRFAEAAVQE
jgi:2-amino-4-hydroxy-6-hydroxymethyldihydropteridine diphosphokinase